MATILDTDTDVIGVLYSSVNSAPKPVCRPSDSLAFVMRASQHEACGSWSIYNQWQHADRALIYVGLSGVGKEASSSKWCTVDEQRRLAWT